jgi:hypothetical protein
LPLLISLKRTVSTCSPFTPWARSSRPRAMQLEQLVVARDVELLPHRPDCSPGRSCRSCPRAFTSFLRRCAPTLAPSAAQPEPRSSQPGSASRRQDLALRAKKRGRYQRGTHTRTDQPESHSLTVQEECVNRHAGGITTSFAARPPARYRSERATTGPTIGHSVHCPPNQCCTAVNQRARRQENEAEYGPEWRVELALEPRREKAAPRSRDAA